MACGSMGPSMMGMGSDHSSHHPHHSHHSDHSHHHHLHPHASSHYHSSGSSVFSSPSRDVKSGPGTQKPALSPPSDLPPAYTPADNDNVVSSKNLGPPSLTPGGRFSPAYTPAGNGNVVSSENLGPPSLTPGGRLSPDYNARLNQYKPIEYMSVDQSRRKARRTICLIVVCLIVVFIVVGTVAGVVMTRQANAASQFAQDNMPTNPSLVGSSGPTTVAYSPPERTDTIHPFESSSF